MSSKIIDNAANHCLCILDSSVLKPCQFCSLLPCALKYCCHKAVLLVPISPASGRAVLLTSNHHPDIAKWPICAAVACVCGVQAHALQTGASVFSLAVRGFWYVTRDAPLLATVQFLPAACSILHVLPCLHSMCHCGIVCVHSEQSNTAARPKGCVC